MFLLKQSFRAIALMALIAVSSLAQTSNSAPHPERLTGRMEALSKRAVAGDTRAQLQMGLAYEFGDGVAKDMDKAMHWYRIAADRGDPVAQTDLGYFYESGANGPKDPAEAAKWYLRAAISGFTRAKFNLGVLYLTGAGVQKSDNEAAHWIGEAADDGCPSALVSLSYLYANGMGVPRDPQKAAELDRNAAKNHNTKRCLQLNPRTSRTSVVSAGLGAETPAP
jgi:TPR repeat protein